MIANFDSPGKSGCFAARHALGWLALANVIGVWLAALLVWPQLGVLAGGYGYGRWVPLHLNFQLYGWTSLPLVGWLFSVFGVDRSPWSRWAAPVVRSWNAALALGGWFWLSGHTSGKLFLDWKDGSLEAFVSSQILLWLLLAAAWWSNRPQGEIRVGLLLGLIALAFVPVGMAFAVSPSSYPPFDRTTGGPTGGSLLGSTLPVVLLLLWIPRAFGLPHERRGTPWLIVLLLAGGICFGVLERVGGTHHALRQIAGLGLLLPWLVLVPLDWRRYHWPDEARFWVKSTAIWWSILIVAGWVDFLPGVLDRMKFTSSLVAHAHLAMAGFVSSFGLLLIAMNGGTVARRAISRGGWSWNAAVALHVIALLFCGWMEGGANDWMDHRPAWREGAFLVRLVSGAVMAGVALYWWRRSFMEQPKDLEK